MRLAARWSLLPQVAASACQNGASSACSAVRLAWWKLPEGNTEHAQVEKDSLDTDQIIFFCH